MQHVNRLPHNRLPSAMKHYSPTGRRNHGRTLKRLLDTWDWNGSTNGPTPWQTHDDDIIKKLFHACYRVILLFLKNEINALFSETPVINPLFMNQLKTFVTSTSVCGAENRIEGNFVHVFVFWKSCKTSTRVSITNLCIFSVFLGVFSNKEHLLYALKTPPMGHGLLIREVSRSHTTTHQSR
jgi:hypothetical protein